ncbi:hypothetical protein HZF03_24340 [Rhodopseudomonas palustris]|nr:hypothetical protein HZF03_24340 [Rhodopseudomonas palustris]
MGRNRGQMTATPHSTAPRLRIATVTVGALLLSVAPTFAQQTAVIGAPPFVATLSNTTPLVFGMNANAAAAALGMPLNYVSGKPGDEIFLVIRTQGGSGFFDRRDRLYLQFRHGRLAGWKGDWGRNWMWQ